MKAVTQDRNLFVEAQVQGLLFQGPAANETGSVFLFVDEDNDRTTGYPIGDLGADSMVEVYGWRDVSTIQHGVSTFAFNETGVTRSNDFRRFLPSGSADAAFLGSQIEIRTTVRDATRARVLVYAADNLGGRDAADGSVRPSLLNLTRFGDSTDSVDVALYRDDGSGALDAADAFLSNASMAANAASLAMNEDLSGPAVYWVEARWTNATPTTTFGLAVSGLGSNGTASFRAPETGLVYLVAAPSTLKVDGAFGDWRGQMYGQDLLGDVTNRTGATEYDANVDLLATAVNVAANFTGYVRVDGRILGGQDIPTSRERTYNAPVDTDLDGVPDSIEIVLGAGLSQDFNNNNRTDAMSAGDVDGDGVIDYPAGTDCWLNTTIPAWYPAPYAGRSVTRFICPIGQSPQEGVDVVYAYIDADNATSTGLLSDVEGRTYGFDYAIAVIGRNGAVNSSGLYVFVPARANPWALVQPIAVALDAHRMEFAVDASALSLVAGYRVVYFASDWRLGYDVALPDAAVARFPIAAQAATNLVINEVSPQPNVEWVEIANPTASAVPLNGWTLAINHGNKAVVVYTFSGTIGAWGSGQEYLAALLPANSLPNGQTQLLLVQGTTVIDATTYSSSSGSGRTWARFKDPVSGVPADTNNDAVDFYVSLAPSSGRANDGEVRLGQRHPPGGRRVLLVECAIQLRLRFDVRMGLHECDARCPRLHGLGTGLSRHGGWTGAAQHGDTRLHGSAARVASPEPRMGEHDRRTTHDHRRQDRHAVEREAGRPGNLHDILQQHGLRGGGNGHDQGQSPERTRLRQRESGGHVDGRPDVLLELHERRAGRPLPFVGRARERELLRVATRQLGVPELHDARRIPADRKQFLDGGVDPGTLGHDLRRGRPVAHHRAENPREAARRIASG